MVDIDFLKRLRQKLQIGNSRSIHLNAYPGRYAMRLDLSDLNFIRKELPELFISELLTKPEFKFKIQINPEDISLNHKDNKLTEIQEERIKKIALISKRFTSILYENDDNFLEHGIKTFGFGFPMIVYRPKNDPSKTINAPIIIWKLDLYRNKNEWIINREEDFGISMNEMLMNFLEQDLNTTNLSRIPDDNLLDNIIDPYELKKICNNLITELCSETKNLYANEEILPLDSINKLREKFREYGNPFITNSGIFGLFKSQKEAVIKDLTELISNSNNFLFDDLITEKYQTTSFSAVETDPAQSKVLTSLSNNNKLIIHGPPGTGKSQSLTAIIVNALANNAKCLVVCEKKTALEVIKKNLELIGLGELCGLIEDVNRDRKNLIKSVRDRGKSTDFWNYNILDNLMSEIELKKVLINKGHKFYSNQILNHYNWTDLVGKFLKLSKKTKNTSKFFEVINKGGYEFDSNNISTDFNRDINIVNDNFNLYKNTRTVVNVFENINDNYIISGSQMELLLKLKSFINNSLSAINECIDYGNFILENYKIKLNVHYAEYKKETDKLFNNILDLYEANIQKSRILFTGNHWFKKINLAVLSLLSKKYKLITKNKRLLFKMNNELLNFDRYNYFNNSVLDSQDVQTIRQKAIIFKEYSDEWYRNINEIINKQTENLDLKSINSKTGLNPNSIKKFNETFLSIIRYINNSRILKITLKDSITSLWSDLNILINLKIIIENIQININEFSDYFEWRNHFLIANTNLKNIFDYLIQIESENWSLDFEVWYIFNILIHYDPMVSLRNENYINSLQENYDDISRFQIEQILNYWRSIQKVLSTEFEKKHFFNIKALYNLAKNNQFNRRNSLRRIINSDFNLFTSYFPVLLLNPTVCSSVFQMKEGLFELVIFDESSQLRIEDVYTAKLRGKYKIVSGDENQMPPSNYFQSTVISIDNPANEESEEDDFELKGISSSIADSESLLEYAQRKGYNETYLEIHYRSKHPNLIEFSNAAFYGSKLKPMPPRDEYKAIRYMAADGIYEQNEGINSIEASKVVEIIDEEVNINGKYNIPSIGIATLNVFQRNHILNIINKKCDENPEFARKIFLLREKKGEELFVKNLENIQGDERDIIIISTTFGKLENGNFFQRFGPLNQEKGYRLLNVIITRAKQKVFVCTSIPENYISEYNNLITANSNKGRGIFYAYIAYAKAIEENDMNRKEMILNLLKEKSESPFIATELGMTESIFEQEVFDMLSEYIEPGRIIIQYHLGGFRIDLAVLSKISGKPLIAIECDGAKYHSSTEAYVWDMFRQKFLEDYGLKFVRIWSVNWWNNPKREMERLIDVIKKYDSY